MLKQIFKKFVPASFYKVESTNKLLLNELKRLFSMISKKILHIEAKSDEISTRIGEQQNALLDLQKHLLATESKLSEMQKQLLSTGKNISEMQTANLNQGKEYLNKLDAYSQNIEELKESVSDIDKIYKYNNHYERKVIQSFHKMYERPDFQQKFQHLIGGLSADDTALIVKILQRQQIVKDSDEAINLFSPKEQQAIKEIQRELDREIFRVSDNMFCFKHYFLPVKHFEASVFIYKHGIDCIENTGILKDKDILDVGGFIGDSILVLKPLTNKRIISFEAVSEHYELMKQTITLNHLDNVIAENMALGHENGFITIEIAGSASAFKANGAVTVKGSEQAALKTLDSYMEGTDIVPGLIKVDIEGAEQDFMEGAKETIARYKPVLLMSIYHNADDFFNIKPIIESWNLGYKFRIHKPVDYSISREVLLIAEVR